MPIEMTGKKLINKPEDAVEEMVQVSCRGVSVSSTPIRPSFQPIVHPCCALQGIRALERVALHEN